MSKPETDDPERGLDNPITRRDLINSIDRVRRQYVTDRSHDSDLIANALHKLILELLP